MCNSLTFYQIVPQLALHFATKNRITVPGGHGELNMIYPDEHMISLSA